MVNHMICPCCGGTIELENDSYGVCDTCMTRMVAGEIIKDLNYQENEIESEVQYEENSYIERNT